MAVLAFLPGLEISIQSQGKALPEHLDDGESNRQYDHLPATRFSSSYLECVSDAEFEIQIELKPPFKFAAQEFTFLAVVDGCCVSQVTITQERFRALGNSCRRSFNARLDRISPTQCIQRVLKFSGIQRVDDADSTRVKKDAELIRELGSIAVTIHRSKRGSTEKPAAEYRVNDKGLPKEVAEKALKGRTLSHGVVYGAQKIVDYPLSPVVKLIDLKNEPLAAIVYKYRSREALQSELIIPRSPSPVLEPRRHLTPRSQSSGDRLSNEERIKKLKQEIANIKEEDDDASSGGRKRLRDEPTADRGGRANKARREASGRVVIDLVDD